MGLDGSYCEGKEGSARTLLPVKHDEMETVHDETIDAWDFDGRLPMCKTAATRLSCTCLAIVPHDG